MLTPISKAARNAIDFLLQATELQEFQACRIPCDAVNLFSPWFPQRPRKPRAQQAPVSSPRRCGLSQGWGDGISTNDGSGPGPPKRGSGLLLSCGPPASRRVTNSVRPSAPLGRARSRGFLRQTARAAQPRCPWPPRPRRLLPGLSQACREGRVQAPGVPAP